MQDDKNILFDHIFDQTATGFKNKTHFAVFKILAIEHES